MIRKIAILLILAIVLNAFFFAFGWAYEEFVTSLNPFLALSGSLLFLLIAIPLTVFTIKRLARYGKDRPGFSPATLFALGFFLFLTGNFIDTLVFGSSTLTLDFQVYDTLFVIAHAHLLIFFAGIALAFSAVYSLYPRLTGRALNAPMGYYHFVVTLVGAYLLCWPLHPAGLAGMPRRYLDYGNWIQMSGYGGIMPFKTKVTILLILAQVLFIVNFIYSSVKGQKIKAAPNSTPH
jgi:cytochrome c oxidase subunit 1